MYLSTFLALISLSLFGAQDSSEALLPKLSVVQVEGAASISPKFLYTVSTEEGEFRVLKGIYLNRKNLDGIQATLVTPIGDTALLVFPEISADSLAKAGARPTSLYVAPGSKFSVELDLLPYWSQFQKSTDSYIGPFPGTYKIRFELGWSDQNWENLIASGIFRGWDPNMVKESLFSDWVSFTIDEDVFTPPNALDKPRKIENEGLGDYDLYVVQKEGMISQEWLIDPETNSQMLVLTHNEPVEAPTKWAKSSLLFGVYPLDIKPFGHLTPTDSVSGSFTAYSIHRNKRTELQEFTGQIVSGNIEGEADFRFLYKQNPQKVIHGHFKQGKMDGQWVEQQIIVEKEQESLHKLAEQWYKEGARNGLCTEFYPKSYGGGLKREAVYLDDKINGANKFYFQNGQLGDVGYFLPEYITYSVNHKEESPFRFPISARSQIKHGEFLGYFEDGSLRHRITYEENIPVGDCEFYYRYGKKEYHTVGSFKDGDYFEGTFIHWEQEETSGYGRHLPSYKFWILHFHQGSLKEKELIIDTSKDPILPPKHKKKLFKKRR